MRLDCLARHFFFKNHLGGSDEFRLALFRVASGMAIFLAAFLALESDFVDRPVTKCIDLEWDLKNHLEKKKTDCQYYHDPLSMDH